MILSVFGAKIDFFNVGKFQSSLVVWEMLWVKLLWVVHIWFRIVSF